MTASLTFRNGVFAWEIAPDDERRFRRILSTVLGVSVILCLLFLLWPKPVPDRTAPPELPPRLAKLVLDNAKPLPPPAPPPPVAAATPVPATKAEPVKKPEPSTNKPDPRKPEPAKKAVVPEARDPVPNKPPGEVLDNVRRKAAGVGLLAMKDQLAEIRGAPLAVQMAEVKPGKGVGTGVGVGVGAGTEPGLPDRAMITSNATNGSGGINTAALSRNTGGGGLAGRATTLVEGVAGGGGGGGPGGGGVYGGKGNGDGTGAGGGTGGKGGTLTKSGSGKASRSIEDVKLVLERNKGAFYSIYNRALREDPSLQGKVVLELKIAPGGNVLDCRIVSSELKQHELEGKLLARIRQIDFGAKDVDQMVVTWPIDFLPS